VSEPLQLDISFEASVCVAEGASRELKLQVAKGKTPLDGGDFGSVLLYLSHDSDIEIADAAINTLRELSGDRLHAVVEAPETHSYLLQILSRLNYEDPEIAEIIASHPAASLETLEFLAKQGVAAAAELYSVETALSELPEGVGEIPEELEVDEEEFKSKYQLAQMMGIAEKIKMALTGDKEWRGILIKDSNKLVSGGVIKNPRITDSEVLTITKSAVQNEEIIRMICSNKEWIKNYNIRKALVENSKTPLPQALRFLSSLNEKDQATLAKSKNVSSVISTQAKRMIMNKNKK
jgi:hypothetical protein